MMTLADRITFTRGRTSGFDYLRIVLAASVIAMHSVITSYGPDVEIEFWHSPWRPYIRLILPMFFALSGFLVAGSLERTKTLGGFLGLRAIRIFPALAVEVFLSAIVIGAIYTTLPLSTYYSSPRFFRYFLNVLGDIHYELPGVFLHNPYVGQVNRQLWTVPFELYCYIALASLALLGLRKRRWMAPVGSAMVLAFYLVSRYLRFGEGVITIGPFPGTMLVAMFLAGVSIYQYRSKIPFSPKVFWPCMLGSMALVWFVPFGEFVVAPLVAYSTVYIGLLDPKRLKIIQGADYSYGVFLYGYVIQQAVVASGVWSHQWLINTVASLAIASVFAAGSWHLIERPALKLRGPLTRAEAWWLYRKKNKAGSDVPAASPGSQPVPRGNAVASASSEFESTAG